MGETELPAKLTLQVKESQVCTRIVTDCCFGAGVFKDVVCWPALRNPPLGGTPAGETLGQETLNQMAAASGGANGPSADRQAQFAAFRGFCQYCAIQKGQNVLREALPQSLWGQQVLYILTVRTPFFNPP